MKLKSGDRVVMHSCQEAYESENYGKVWTCKSDEFTVGIGEYRFVYLEGYKFGNNGDFPVNNLQYVNTDKM
ncbi:hypothetical protein [Paenibacillus medicaginis]|uniref:DUF5348 domain-containing protein n=1 Tax=Paenibacillus medicaginis TaxID=1470560 RepID=A0ABV5BV36_9BACL